MSMIRPLPAAILLNLQWKHQYFDVSMDLVEFSEIKLEAQEKIFVLDLTWLLLGKPARALLWLGFSQGKEPSQQTPAVDVLPHPGKNLVK